MAQVVLGLYVMTMFGGAYLISFTTGIGRPDSTARATALPPLVTFTHPLLALSGLAVWLVFMAEGSAYLAWTSVVVLLATAALGDVLALRTFHAKPQHVRVGPRARRLPARREADAPLGDRRPRHPGRGHHRDGRGHRDHGRLSAQPRRARWASTAIRTTCVVWPGSSSSRSIGTHAARSVDPPTSSVPSSPPVIVAS